MAQGDQKNLPRSGAGEITSVSGFQPFLVAMQKRTIKNEGAGGAGGTSLVGSSRVEVVAEEGLVGSMKVHCKCGEVTVIECDYSEG
jgi:hypothetical protein